MSGSLRSPLTKILNLIEREIVSSQVQQRIEQHAAMTRGQQKPIAVFPFGIARVVAHELRPQHIGHRRSAQRQTRMTRVRFLDRVERQCANRVNAKLIEFGIGVSFLLHACAHGP